MLSTILGLIVAGFCAKHVFGIAAKLILGLMGKGALAIASTSNAIGRKADSKVADTLLNGSVSLPFKKAPTTAAMAQFVVNVEDFGKVVFGSEQELISTVAAKTVEAMAEKLSTEDGKEEVAKRLADLSQQKTG